MEEGAELVIKLYFGDDSLQEAAQAAPLLREVAEKLEAGQLAGRIHDQNGNWVGDYSIYTAH
jgi:hypothetical protein